MVKKINNLDELKILDEVRIRTPDEFKEGIEAIYLHDIPGVRGKEFYVNEEGKKYSLIRTINSAIEINEGELKIHACIIQGGTTY